MRAEEERHQEEENKEEQKDEPAPPPSSSSRPEPITIAPVGLDPEETALHDEITEELHEKFRAMPQSDKEALRERMREEAREPTKDAIVAAVACGLSYEEICAMARVASDAAREAEEGLGQRWGEMAKTRLEPSAEEMELARESARVLKEMEAEWEEGGGEEVEDEKEGG